MAGAIEKIGVAERDMLSAGGHLGANVFKDDIPLHNTEAALVDRDHGTMAAQVLAPAAGLGIPHAPCAAVHGQLRICFERRQAAAVRRQKLLAGE